MRINFNSLLTRFLISASVGLISSLVLGGLLFRLTSSTQEIVESTRFSQQRMSAFTEIQYALDRYISARVTAGSNTARAEDTFLARSLYLNSIRKIQALPEMTPVESSFISHIVDKAHEVDRVLQNFSRINTRVNQTWSMEGHQAALDDARDRMLPYFDLKELLRQQILDDQYALERTSAQATELQARTAPIALTGILVAIIACAIVFLLLIRRLIPGLKTIEQGAQAFGRNQITHPIVLNGKDELNGLASTFNVMAEQLRDKQLELEQLNEDLEQRVRQRTEELRALNDKLARTDEQRRHFFADIGHELRTPLTIIRGEAQLALRTPSMEEDDLNNVFGRIVSQTRFMARLVDDLFLIAKAEAGGLQLNIEEIDIISLLRELQDDFHAIATEIGAVIDAPDDHAPALVIRADLTRLRQMLVLLIDNALHHTKAGVRITLAAHGEGADITITVSDDGPGFPPHLSNELFERFKRGQSDTEGSGLGLTLVRALASAHGGSASLGNKQSGGACATIILPAR